MSATAYEEWGRFGDTAQLKWYQDWTADRAALLAKWDILAKRHNALSEESETSKAREDALRQECAEERAQRQMAEAECRRLRDELKIDRGYLAGLIQRHLEAGAFPPGIEAPLLREWQGRVAAIAAALAPQAGERVEEGSRE